MLKVDGEINRFLGQPGLPVQQMPAVNIAGNASNTANAAPFAASVAEMTKRPISVAVSNPKPNRNPIGKRCQLSVTALNSG